MAGIAGMGQPSDIHEQAPDVQAALAPSASIEPTPAFNSVTDTQAPPDMPQQDQASQGAPSAPQRPSLEDIFSGKTQVQAQPAARPSLESIFNGTAEAPPPAEEEDGTLAKLGKGAFGAVTGIPYDIAKKAVGMGADALSTVAEHIPSTQDFLEKTSFGQQPVDVSGKAALRSAYAQAGMDAPDEALAAQQDVHPKAAQVLGPALDAALTEGASEALPAIGRSVKAIGSDIGKAFTAWNDEKNAAQALKIGDRVVPVADQISQGAENIDQAVSKLKELGLEPVMLPAQRNLLDPKAQAIAKELAAEPAIQAAHSYIADQTEQMFSKVADMSGANYSGTRQDIGGGFTDAIKGIRKQEGEIIGATRQAAIEQAGKTPLPVPELQSNVKGLAEGLGFKFDTAADTKIPSAQDLVNTDMVENPANAEKLLARVNEVHEKLANADGKLTMEELHDTYNSLAKQVDRIWKQSSPDVGYRSQMTQLKDAVRDELTSKVGTVLQDTPQGALYQPMLDSFSSKAQSMKDLAGIMKKGDITSASLAQKIASGDMSRKGLAAAENILSTHDPALWSDLTGQVFQNIFDKNTSSPIKTLANPVRTNWIGVDRDIDKLGEAKQILFRTPGSEEAMKAVTTFGRNVFEGTPSITTPGEIAQVSKTVHSLSKLTRPMDGAIDMMTSLDRQKKVANYLAQGGIEQIVKQVPKADAPRTRLFLQRYLAQPSVSSKKLVGSTEGQ